MKSSAIDWEQFMGARLFAWAGGFALFLALVFFLKYAFENDLISPWVQVAGEYLLCAGLLLGGAWMHRRTRCAVTAQTLCATAVLGLYAVTFAAHSYYRLIGLAPCFAVMALATAAAFLLSVRLDAQAVAVLGLLGGFLTPPLLSTGRDNPIGLFGYIALLDIGLIAAAARRRWNHLPLLAALGTAAVQAGWAAEFFIPSKAFVAMGVFLGFEALFLAALALADRENPWGAAAAAVTAFMPLAFTLYLLTFRELGEKPWIVFAFVLGADLGALALAVIRPPLAPVQFAAGCAAWYALALWTAAYASPGLLCWALGAPLPFAILHTAFPAFRRRGTGAPRARALDPRAQGRAAPAALPFALLVLVTLRVPLADPSPVFGAAMLLVVLLLGVARRTGEDLLGAAGLLSALALEWAWHQGRFSPERAVLPLAWYSAFAAVFTLYPFLFGKALLPRTAPWAVAAAALPLHFPLLHHTVKTAWPNPAMGLLPAACAIPPLAGLARLLREVPPAAPNRNALLAWFGGAALLFATLVFPVQFERQWITLGWALEGAALLWLFRRVPHPGLRLAGTALLCAAFVRLALNPAVLDYHPRADRAILNWYLYAYGVAAACLFAGALLLAPPRHRIGGLNARAFLGTLGTALAFLLVNIEIADYFTPPGSLSLTFRFSGDFGRDMTYSIAWAAFALALLVAGIARRLRPARCASLSLLGVTLLKLFLHDLARLNQMYRIGAFVGVAVILLVSSFLYQRFVPREPG